MRTLLFISLLFTTMLYGQCPPPGEITLSSQADVNNFISTYPNCDTISGNLYISGTVNDLSALDYLLYIEGDLTIRSTQLTTVSNFYNLIEVLNTIDISENTLLTEIIGFNELIHLSMVFYIENNPNLVTINGFNSATNVFIQFWINTNASLQTITGFSSLETVDGFFGINDSPLLNSIPSFNNLSFVSWGIQFYNTGLTNISGFDNLISIGDFEITDGLNFSNNQNLVSISGFNCLKTIVIDVLIQDNPLLETISGLCSLESVGQHFAIRNNASLTTLNGLQSLTSISTAGSEGSVVFEIYDNPQLSDCDALCNLLSSNGIIGLTNITNNQTGCDSESEINTSNCIPFEILDCTNLINPFDGDINVAVDTNISWNAVSGATGYIISIGTTSEGTEIVNNLNVGNVTTYIPLTNLPETTEIFVKIKAYSNNGQAKCCGEESFTTTVNIIAVSCANLTTPLNNATNVNVTSNIIWNTVSGATGYIINIGTSNGGTDIVNNFDVGNTTTYNPPINFPENTTIYITIIPYNSLGQANGCIEEQFTTETFLPNCTILSNPLNNSTNVSTSTNINWDLVLNASGYIISIGTFSGGTDLVNNLDVGNIGSYNPPVSFPENTTIFVTITSYNSVGNNINCVEEKFTTQGNIPNCTGLLSPLNQAVNVDVNTIISWNTSSLTTGYLLNIGLTPLGSEIINNLDVGNTTSYNLLESLSFNTSIYVKITPYNNFGQALYCQIERFITSNVFVFVPSYFTPNNDGYNDKWIVKDPLNEIEVIYIYNRFGKLLSTLTNLQEGWNGVFNNQLLPSNDYWYIMKLNNGNKKSGHFTLKR